MGHVSWQHVTRLSLCRLKTTCQFIEHPKEPVEVRVLTPEHKAGDKVYKAIRRSTYRDLQEPYHPKSLDLNQLPRLGKRRREKAVRDLLQDGTQR